MGLTGRSTLAGAGEDGSVSEADQATSVEAPPAILRVSVALDRVGQVAAVACGLVILVPATAGLLAQAGAASLADWAILAAALAISGSALARPLRQRGSTLVAAGGLVLLLAPWLPLNYQTAWLALPSVTMATCGVAALAMPWRPAVLVIVAASALSWLDGNRLPSLDPPVGAEPALLPTLALLSGLGLTLLISQLRRTVARADERSDELRRLIAAQAEELAVMQGRMATQRRIHETVLNTLQAISMGIAQDHKEQAQSACRRDLAELQQPALPAASASVMSIVATSIEQAATDELTVMTHVTAPEPLSPSVAAALRDALVESLRNVARHAQVGQVQVTARQAEGISEVTIIDAGPGLTPQALARFGRDSGVVRGIEAVSGSYEITSAPGRGTSVRIRVPNADVEASSATWPLAAPDEVPLTTMYVGLSTLARIGMLGNVACLALWLPWIGRSLTSPALPIGLMSAFVFLNAVLILAWQGRWRVPVATTTVLVSTAGLLSLAIGPRSCTGAVASISVIATMGGAGLLLAMTALPRGWPRIATVMACGIASVLVTLSLPSACRPSLQTAIDVTAFLAAIAYALHWIDVAFAQSQEQAQRSWQQLLQQQVQARARAARLRAWSEVDDEARELLAAVAAGEVELNDPATRERASSAADRIRARLRTGSANVNAPAYAQELRSRIPRLPAPVVTGPVRRADPFPDSVIDAIQHAVEGSSPGPWTWHVFASSTAAQPGGHEQHVMRGPAPSGSTTPSGPAPLYGLTQPENELGEADCRISLVTTEVETSVLVTRSAQPAPIRRSQV